MFGQHRNVKVKVKVSVRGGRRHPGKYTTITFGNLLLETGYPNDIKMENNEKIILEG